MHEKDDLKALKSKRSSCIFQCISEYNNEALHLTVHVELRAVLERTENAKTDTIIPIGREILPFHHEYIKYQLYNLLFKLNKSHISSVTFGGDLHVSCLIMLISVFLRFLVRCFFFFFVFLFQLVY